MISEEGLLQANATIIAGILIFLTIAPISKGVVSKILERTLILSSICFTLAFLVFSITLLLFGSYVIFPLNWFLYAKIFFLIGLFNLPVTVGLILRKIPHIENKQKGED